MVKVIRCISDFQQACISKTAGLSMLRVEWNEIWASKVCIQGRTLVLTVVAKENNFWLKKFVGL